MMMSHDSSQMPLSRLDDETLNTVRGALREYLRDANDPGALQASLLLMASEARTRSMLPEQLLIVLKDVWHGLPEVRSMHDTREQVPMLQRVVTMCIKEYYNS